MVISLKSILSSIVFLIPDLLDPNFTNQNTAEFFFFTFVLGVLLIIKLLPLH